VAGKAVQGYSLDIDVIEGLRQIASATDIPASRLANRALAAFIREHKDKNRGAS
jgi:predicted transcriptional regulator